MQILNYMTFKIMIQKYTSFFKTKSNYFSIASIFKLNIKDNYYIIGLMAQVLSDENDYFLLYKLAFNTIDIANNSPIIKIKKLKSFYETIVSCFESENNYIICFYHATLTNYSIIVLDNELNEIKNKTIAPVYIRGIFYKCVHFKGNAGAFLYYDSDSNIIVEFKEYNNEDIIDYFNLNPKIKIKNYNNYYNNVKLNDMIKLEDSKFCFISISSKYNYLNIIIVNNYFEDKIKIRYYIYRIKDLYSYSINRQLSISTYNGFIAMSCNGEFEGESKYGSVIIFGYPNSTDFIIDLNDNFTSYNINFYDKCKIENNILGYIFEGIKIIDFSKGIKLLNGNNKLEIQKGDIIDNNVELALTKDIINIKGNLRIEYSMVVKEPDYELYNKFPTIIDVDFCGNDYEEEKKYFERKNYIGRISYCDIFINSNNITDECEENCEICLKNQNMTCITCKYLFEVMENGEKKCLKKDDIPKITNLSSEITIKSSIIIKENISCTKEEIINNKCKNNINFGQLNEVKDQIINESYSNGNYSNENIIIRTNNVIIQLSTLEEQKNKNYKDISSIDLGICEYKLKLAYKIPKAQSLIIFKTDIKIENLPSKYIAYEVYHPLNLERLNLSICVDDTISINVPIELDKSVEELYNNLNELGYNLFDKNDLFYQDICASYTTQNGTDILLSDRQNDIYTKSKKELMCQKGCKLILYNSTNKKSKCNCSVKTTSTNDLNIKNFFSEEGVDTFYKALTHSNFHVIKCYRLIFNLILIFKNIGQILMTIIILLYIILIIIYCIKGPKKIQKLINFVSQLKNIKTFNNYKEKKINITKKITKKRKNKILPKKTDKELENKKVKKPSFHKSNKIRSNNNIFFPNNISKKKELSLRSLNCSSIISENTNIKKLRISENQVFSNKKSEKMNIINKNDYRYFNDYELNKLKYELALELDNRTYMQYYWSLLKRKQLILFTFVLSNDYNLIFVKISLLLISFSLYITVNCLFFNDETMHALYKNNGNYKLSYKIPQLLYSSIASNIIKLILRALSLSENSILELKKEKNINKMINKSKEVKFYLKIKFIIYFILSLLLMTFFWYYI